MMRGVMWKVFGQGSGEVAPSREACLCNSRFVTDFEVLAVRKEIFWPCVIVLVESIIQLSKSCGFSLPPCGLSALINEVSVFVQLLMFSLISDNS